MKPIFALAAMLCAIAPMYAQNETSLGADASGVITYSLPATSLTVEVEAVQEHFYAGPYAAYAQKYLGIEVRQKDDVKCTITELTLEPRVEADFSARYTLEVDGKGAETQFLRLTSQGLVSTGSEDFGKGSKWRFPSASGGDFSELAVTSNLTSGKTTLYKNSSSSGRVAVSQNMLVEKSPEARAAEAAQLIFDVRKKRLQIVTGDTDATYSGEAMGAAVEELTRLEKEYMTMFTGYSDCTTQKMSFDVVPSKDRDSQMYVAFRVSDTEGLLSAESISGRPVIMEVVPVGIPEVTVDKKAAKAASKVPTVTYRLPATCTVRLLDGMNVLMQSRMLVYQLGTEASMPVNLKTK